jgi:hypothetical protein
MQDLKVIQVHKVQQDRREKLDQLETQDLQVQQFCGHLEVLGKTELTMHLVM